MAKMFAPPKACQPPVIDYRNYYILALTNRCPACHTEVAPIHQVRVEGLPPNEAPR